MLTILLTSYNRPRLLRKALDSLAAQTCPDWRCLILDDNSNEETHAVIREYLDDTRFTLIPHETTDEERQASVRYSALINTVLPSLHEGVVGYLCDNVEYHPDLVGAVLDYFEHHPDIYAGYAVHERDVWKVDGSARLGSASDFGHWDMTPQRPGREIAHPFGQLDHSQVFHRLPCPLHWPEEVEAKRFGDGVFYSALAERYGPIQPIAPQVLTYEHLMEGV